MTERPVILITGATAGIGRHAALHLARRGMHVIATGRKVEQLDALAAEARGLRLDVLPLDVTSQESIERAHAAVQDLTGRRGVDVLVNNAGYGVAAPALETTDEDLRRQFETNVFGLMAVTRAFVPAMIARRSGRVINVSSIGGRFTFPFFGAYNGTKYAIESLSDALRRELGGLGVRVVLIEPGLIRSNFVDTSMGLIDRYRSPSSPWANVYARADEFKVLAERSAAGPECIAEAIEHAITARRPKIRYMAPFSSRIFVWLMENVPTRIVDSLVSRALGIGKHVPVIAASAPARTTGGDVASLRP